MTNSKLLQTILFLTLLTPRIAHSQIIVTVAGDSTAGYNGDNITATTAELKYPQSLAMDGIGTLLIGDIGNNRIRKLTGGVLTTFAGNGNPGYSGDEGPATDASVNAAYMAVGPTGDVYVTDPLYNRIRRIGTDGLIHSFAGTGAAAFSGDGGPATAAAFNQPSGLAADKNGNVFVADYGNNRIRRIDAMGIVSTVAGGGAAWPGDNGPATDAVLASPSALCVDDWENLFVASGSALRRIDSTGMITSIVPLIPPYPLFQPSGIAADHQGLIYVSDASSQRVYQMNYTGTIFIYAGHSYTGAYGGDGGPATAAKLNTPLGIALDDAGSLFISDNGNSRVRCVVASYESAPSIITEAHPSIFPNPCNGIFDVNVYNQTCEVVKVSIVSVQGQLIRSFETRSNETNRVPADLAPGIYIITFSTEDRQWSEQLVVRERNNQ